MNDIGGVPEGVTIGVALVIGVNGSDTITSRRVVVGLDIAEGGATGGIGEAGGRGVGVEVIPLLVQL